MSNPNNLVTLNQLKTSFKTHFKAKELLKDKGVDSSQLLILFYGIECLLKAEYLKCSRLPNWEGIDEKDRKELGHNLTKIVSKCKLNNFTKVTIDNSISDYHQCLRYGNCKTRFGDPQRNNFNQYLNDLATWAFSKGGYNLK